MPLPTHLRTEELIDYVDGRADAPTSERVRTHAPGCSACGAELTYWTRTLQALCSDRTPAPPDWVRQRAFNLVHREPKQPRTFERLLARIVSDSRMQAGVAGARDAGTSQFKLFYEASDRRVDLLWERDGRGWNLSGQVLSPEPPPLGWRVIVDCAEHHEEVRSDALGEFSLRGLPAGACEICLAELEREIVLPTVQLADRLL